MKPVKPPFSMDERSKLTAMKVIALMYFLTIIALQGITIYRQLVLGQSIHDFEDFAIVLTANSLFLISALLYFGAVPVQKLKISTVLLIYAVIVVLGSVFTYLKYHVFLYPGLPARALIGKALIIAAVSGLIVLFFVIFSLLGKRRMDKELEG